jgi:uncharacterized membrane-anchored protein
MTTTATPLLNKVPQITLGFWIIKILSTTVGETAADTLAVDVGFGTAITGIAMGALLVAALIAQMRARRHVPWLYWATVLLVSIVGTQITDALTDGMGVSLYASTAVLAVALAAVFIEWYRIEGTLDVATIVTRRREAFYWAAILCTFALGTAAGDLATEALAMGFQWGVAVFAIAIVATFAAWRMGLDAIAAFWIAYVLTRPLGASLGDLLSQATTYGGLGFGALATSVLFILVIAGLVAIAQVRAMRAA